MADGNNQHSFEVKIGGVIGEERYSQRSFKANLFCRVVFPLLIDNPEVREVLAENSEIMKKANTAISVMEMSPRDEWLYDSRMKYEHDRASCISEGYRQGIEVGILQGEIKGRQEGISQGFADGSYKKALETAKLMRTHNYPITEICTMTGLTKEEVENI